MSPAGLVPLHVPAFCAAWAQLSLCVLCMGLLAQVTCVQEGECSSARYTVHQRCARALHHSVSLNNKDRFSAHRLALLGYHMRGGHAGQVGLSELPARSNKGVTTPPTVPALGHL